MVAQVVAILALMLASDLAGEPGRWLRLLGLGAMWVVLGLALWSAVEYYQTFAAVVSGRTVPPSDAADEPDPDHRAMPLTGIGYDFGGVCFGTRLLRRRLLRRRLLRRRLLR